MGVSGKYVDTFAEATHALPNGMHMNSNYPFMLPRIARTGDGKVTLISSSGDEQECRIVVQNGVETCSLKQSSTYELIFKQPPSTWVFYPFNGEQL